MPATVVLVHGAFHGAWCWDRVVDALAREGVRAVALDLPGHGADEGPLVDLHGDAARVRAVLDTIGPPVVLVGHSYGGAVITEAGDHEAVGHLVYLAALALDRDETCGTVGAALARSGAIAHDGRPDFGAAFVSGGDGTLTLATSAAAACLYNDCDAETVEWALTRIGPQPTAGLRQTPSSVAWSVKPSTYVVCADDLAVHPDLQRLLATRCGTTVEWDTGHSPFLSRPDLVTDLLAGLAAEART